MTDTFIANVSWVMYSTYHTVSGLTPSTSIFSQDTFFDIPYLADWSQIGKRRQDQVDESNIWEHKSIIDFDYKIGKKVLLINEGINHKAEHNNKGPFVITEVFSN